MSETSHVLGLPYIQPAQAQKHVTHNEALRVLDAIVQLAVQDRDLTAPPATPGAGDRHIVSSGATGAWSGKDNQLALFEDSAWAFFEPQIGWQAFVASELAQVVWDGSNWISPSGGAGQLQNQTFVGVNTTADTTNRLAVSSDATLLSHEGTDHRLVVNKSALTDTASLVFQSNWTGHAEMGLTGAADFTLRVSPDGSTFVDALRADAATGVVAAPQGVTFGGTALSHYEEGTWTPRLTFGGSDVGMVYNLAEGVYSRIGNLVCLQIAIELSTKGTGTGVAEIQDIPFDPLPLDYPGNAMFISGGANLQGPICRTMPGNAIRLMNTGTSGSSDITDANFTDTTSFKLVLMHTV